MGVEILTREQHVREPWRNGQGSTTVVASSHARGADFDWRVSIASVQRSGAFSTFPGVDRILLPLGHGPLELVVDGVPHEVDRFEPIAFDGEARTACVTPEPMQDLNVMVRRGRAAGRLEVLDSPCRAVEVADLAFVVVLEGEPRVGDTVLSVGDAIRIEGGSVCVDGDGKVAVAHIDRAVPSACGHVLEECAGCSEPRCLTCDPYLSDDCRWAV